MIEYIARHKDQNPQLELQELNQHIEYGCSDPRMHPLHQDKAERSSKEAEKRIDDDFGNLTKVLQDYVEDHKVLPYCMILHSLAYRYLGGGLSDPTYKDAEFPYRSSPQITAMFWNLGNWCRNKFEKCPVPERFQSFHTLTTLSMRIMKNLMKPNHSSTITSSMSSRTLEDIFS